ncbi:MAG: 2-amino-4-hydroxy-6-hydroxymethyldihydropteridine diphosphokinase [Planctomycetota bacterium]|jgi:2-amino-4-hydroxy-6-hydroxymethyldihydropteridine diphosphokinase
MTDERVFIGLGSNQGDRRGNLDRGLEAMAAIPRTRLVRASRFFWTPPWGFRDQPWFLNAAAELATGLAPRALMDALLAVEQDAGRVRTVPNGPRTLDLDILLFGQRIVEEEGLMIPHPRMTERLFVLVPLSEIAPDVVHPQAGSPIRELLDRLEPEGIEAQVEGETHETF